MRTFQYANREYTPSVDLNTLGQTFSTLEQGHKEAVKAASDLETVVSNLNMNEAEDGFKQQLINEIQNTIDENTIYGNSYAALDNLILKAGSIASDGRVTGRLRSQAAKEKYDAKVDAMAITDGMKQMYKETNPYYYEDGELDKRTGKYLPGKLWQPTTNPVATVSEAEIQRYALQVAAKDAGSSESVSFLDANGRPTSDPMKSEDGTMYKKVGTRWERLSASKLAQAYKMAIDSIPGAKESLHQDYTYARWNYDKLVNKARQTGGDITPFVAGFTDKNGNIYTEDQWLNNKIQGFTDVAAYSHSFRDVSFGPALANRKAREQQAKIAAQNAKDGFTTFLAGTEEVEVNSFVGAENAKAAANKQALEIYDKYFADRQEYGDNSISDIIRWYKNNRNPKVYGPNIVANYFINKAGNRMSNEDKIKLINSFNAYYQANSQMKSLITAAGKDADALRFGSNAINQIYTNDNKYGRQIINELNDYFKHNKEAKWQVGSQIMEGIAKKYETSIEGLRQMGINISLRDDGNYDVSINANRRMLVPKFASTVREVNKEVPGTIGGYLKNRFTTGVDETNFHEYGVVGNLSGSYYGSTKPVWTTLSDLYNKSLEASRKINEKVGITKGTISYNGIAESSFTGLWWDEYGKSAGYTEEQIRRKKEEANENVDNAFANGAFDAANIKYVGKDNRTIKDVAKDQDAKTLIQMMYRNPEWRKTVSRSCMVPYGANPNQPLGYIVGFTVPEEVKVDGFKEGKTYKFVVSGFMEEDKNYNPSTNPRILAENAMLISRSSNSNIENIGYSTSLGDTRIIPKGNNKYSTSMFGNTKSLNGEEAVYLSESINTLRNIKYQYQSDVYNNATAQQELKTSLDKIINTVSIITNKNPIAIELMVGNYLTSYEE